MIGQPVRRKEDHRFLTGRGQYVEDVRLPGTLHLGVVRSLHAHARIVRIDGTAARALPGVHGFVTAEDHPEFAVPFPRIMPVGRENSPYCDLDELTVHYPLARGETHYQGQPIAVVLADSPAAAADAVEAVVVDYEPLPVAGSLDEALRPGGPRVHADVPNVVAHLRAEVGDVDAAVRTADIVIEDQLELPRIASMPIEGRAVLAAWDPATEGLVIWSTNQAPYFLRDTVARTLGLARDRVRVVSRDIGGAFGGKGLSVEDLVVAVLAYRRRQPVQWIETRTEDLLSVQSGGQRHRVRLAATRHGVILGMEVTIHKDVGAYNYYGPLIPSNTLSHLGTHYKVPSLRADAFCVLTNRVPTRATRGAGRPEATFVMDRLLDRLARETRLDPFEVRRRNIVSPADMPYRTGLRYRDGVAIAYDGGDYPRMLRRAVELAGYEEWRRRQPFLRAQGRLVGVAISSYLEGGGIGPCEGARVRIEENGQVSVTVGVNAQGQSHATTLAQVCAQHLGARFDDVVVSGGDTALFPAGFGTGASRIAVNTGNAVRLAAIAVWDKIRRLAAALLECDERDVQVEDGRAWVAGVAERSLSFAELARAAARTRLMADPDGPELGATAFFYPRTVTWSSGVHVAVVEVDADTGTITVLAYAVVHDCGTPLNPLVVEGQIDGGVVHGMGNALGEEIVYDDEGQLLSGTLMEYLVPRAADVSPTATDHLVLPTDANPLGVRAVGESGAISPPAVIAGAVEDALQGRVRVTRVPLTPRRVFELIEAWRAAAPETRPDRVIASSPREER